MGNKLDSAVLAFNRGLVSPLALARVDLKRLAWSAEVMVNWMPRKFGTMMLRPGLAYVGATQSNEAARFISFTRSRTVLHLIEFTNLVMRVWTSEELLTRLSVTTAVANGNFTSNLTSWTDNDESGAASAWVTGGYMGLTGDGTARAIRDQQVTVAVADQGIRHALSIVVYRGPVTLRVGSTSGGDDYLEERTLRTGYHSLSFVPTGDFHIRFMSSVNRQVLVDSCNVEAAGAMTITTPYTTSDLDLIRTGPDSQSADVMFVGCIGHTQRRLERWDSNSWSLVQYQPEDGPFRNQNVGPVTLQPSAITGNITIASSEPIFRASHAPSADESGALFSITSDGQRVEENVTVQNTFSDPIRITGVDASRIFFFTLEGTWSATVTLQRSLDSEDGPWEDVETYTTNQVTTFDDGLDNQIAWYRMGVATGDFTSGTVEIMMFYSLGSIRGIVRITAFNNASNVDAEVLSPLGALAPTDDWQEGQWSRFRGWPSSGCIYESRLGWAGLDKINLTITDVYDGFDEEFEGDAGPISRSIGSGPVETIDWSLPLERLMLGGAMSEFQCRSSNFDEPLTPTNFNIKDTSNQGSAAVQAVKLGRSGLFVERGGMRLFELAYNGDTFSYQANDLCNLVPEIGDPGIVRIAVQRQPDTRIHCVLSDGTAAVLVFDKTENVACWLNVETSGDIEDVVVRPSGAAIGEDRVYYVVKRTINGSTVRYFERWALESECVGGSLNRQADSHVLFSQASSVTVGGLTHLVGEDVIVWQNGVCIEDADGFPKTYEVNGSGEITLDTAATAGVVGLPYEASWQSAKLGDMLVDLKIVEELGVVLANSHRKGLYYGPSLNDDDLDTMPLIEDGTGVNVDTIITAYNKEPFEFDGDWDPDSRVCLKAFAPRPVNILAAVIRGEWNA